MQETLNEIWEVIVAIWNFINSHWALQLLVYGTIAEEILRHIILKIRSKIAKI